MPRAEPPAEWTAWRAQRRESLTGENGWLTLIGLFWLEPGENAIGSAESNAVVLPADRAPSELGTLVRDGTSVTFRSRPGAGVTVAGAPIDAMPLVSDQQGEPTTLEVGSLRMHVIVRGDRVGLRVKDRESPARRALGEIPVFDYDPRFKVHARIERPSPARTLPIVNVLGMTEETPVIGVLHFELEGHAMSLAAIPNGPGPDDGLFVLLRDATSEEGETYGAGRYLDVEASGTATEVDLDFNYLYTPPCGYTEHATCPLPPEENVLPIAIRAGEKYDFEH